MLESCTRPDLVTEITLQPLRRYDVDAAILFSDIVVPLRAVGVDVDIKPGVGPVLEPARSATADDVERLRPLEPSDVPYITEAVKSLVGELGGKPLIGFAGGPFTLASYLIEGGPSQEPRPDQGPDVRRPGAVARADGQAGGHRHRVPPGPGRGRGLGRAAVRLLGRRGEPGRTTGTAILPHTSRIFAALAGSGVPRIHFGVGTGELLGLLGEAGADVVGVDWRVPLDEAARRVGGRQGRRRATWTRRCCWPAGTWSSPAPARSWPGPATLGGHVFNLGHGVLPETDPDILARLTDLVHEVSGAAA